MAGQHQIGAEWYTSTGFLNGVVPSLSPEDPYRISTNILPVYPPLGWQFQATGSLFPGAELGVQGGMSSYPVFDVGVPLYELTNYRDEMCLANCTMGGCADPTSHQHKQCVAAGCCGCPRDAKGMRQVQVHVKGKDGKGNSACAPFAKSGWQQDPMLPFNTIRGVTPDCVPGSKQYCESELNYFNCNPSSLLTPDTDPTCAGFAAKHVPW